MLGVGARRFALKLPTFLSPTWGFSPDGLNLSISKRPMGSKRGWWCGSRPKRRSGPTTEAEAGGPLRVSISLD